MTLERAIEILDPSHREHYNELPDGMEQVNEACRMGMMALKKQKPNKPVLTKDGHLACSCGLVLQEGNRRRCFYYCDRCGQAIDWGDDE